MHRIRGERCRQALRGRLPRHREAHWARRLSRRSTSVRRDYREKKPREKARPLRLGACVVAPFDRGEGKRVFPIDAHHDAHDTRLGAVVSPIYGAGRAPNCVVRPRFSRRNAFTTAANLGVALTGSRSLAARHSHEGVVCCSCSRKSIWWVSFIAPAGRPTEMSARAR